MIGKQPLNRYTRYQGAIVRNHSILLIRHRENESGRSYWILPGGGIEPGETEEDCVRWEMKEETNLDVQVSALLLDEPAGLNDIVEVRWFDLSNEEKWDSDLINDPIIYLPLQHIRGKLGYLP
jgi:8-oxo-dGTP pyrophosphatase MutT (NUDIX family)